MAGNEKVLNTVLSRVSGKITEMVVGVCVYWEHAFLASLIIVTVDISRL